MDLKKSNNKVWFIIRPFYNLNQNGDDFFFTRNLGKIPVVVGVGAVVVVCVGTVGKKVKRITEIS